MALFGSDHYLYWRRRRRGTPVGAMPASHGKSSSAPLGSPVDLPAPLRRPTTDERTGTGRARRSAGHVTSLWSHRPRSVSLPSLRHLAEECWRRCDVDRWPCAVAETASASASHTSLPGRRPHHLQFDVASLWLRPTSVRTSATTLTAADWSSTEDPSYWTHGRTSRSK